MPYIPLQKEQPPKPHHHIGRWLAVLIVLTGVVGGIRLVSEHHLIIPKLSAHAVLVKHISEPTTAQITTMNQQINNVIAQNPNMDIGVSVINLDNNQTYNYGETDPFIAASVGKLITASLYLQDVQNGTYTMSQELSYDTAQNELKNMIVNSDNTAWTDFNGLLGHDALQNYGNQIGLTNYDPDVNTMTASDISSLLSKLYKGQLLNPTNTQLLLSYMKQADTDYGQYIVAAVPSGVTVYHKVGWLSDRVHDAAIITDGTHSYVLVIFTKAEDGSNYDETAGEQVFHQITQATDQTFLGRS